MPTRNARSLGTWLAVLPPVVRAWVSLGESLDSGLRNRNYPYPSVPDALDIGPESCDEPGEGTTVGLSL